MYPKLKFSDLRISSKLFMLNLMIWVSFLLIIGIVSFSFSTAQNRLSDIAKNDLGRVIGNSQTTRMISELFTDINLVSYSFYNDNKYLSSERDRLLQNLHEMMEMVIEPDLNRSLVTLSEVLNPFLNKCFDVNNVLQSIETIRGDIYNDLEDLENLIALMLVNMTLEGEDISFLEQLLTLVVGYSESLLKIDKFFAELGHRSYIIARNGNPSQLLSLFDDLLIRLQSLSASIPDIARFGKKVETNVVRYKEAVIKYDEEMSLLGMLLAELNHTRDMSMSLIVTIEDKINQSTILTIRRIHRIILSSGVVIVVLIAIIIISLNFAGTYLLKTNIKNPMMSLLNGLESFGKGHFQTKIKLNRKDEWGTIESAFNSMAADLRKTYSALQNAHYELEQRVENRTAELTTVNKELKHKIGELENTQEALRESEERFRLLSKATYEGIAFTKNGIFLDTNDQFAEMFGYKPPKPVGLEILNLVSPDSKEMVLERVNSGYDKPYEFIARRKDGTTFEAEAHGKTTSYEGQSIRITAIRDISERKKIEEERKSLIAELESRNTELEQFFYTVSHDLKSPLITIKGFLGYIEQDAVKGNVDRIKTDIQRITAAVDRMKQLLEELLKLSRIGRIVNKPEEFTFEELTKEVINAISVRLEDHKVTFQVMDTKTKIRGDRLRMHQVMENLLINAVKFSKDQKNTVIEIGTRRKGIENIHFVRDNGMGIEKKFHKKVFDLFERLDNSKEGTGVGLAIVKRIIEVHGGRIWIESDGIGKGSTFCFTLADQLYLK